LASPGVPSLGRAQLLVGWGESLGRGLGLKGGPCGEGLGRLAEKSNKSKGENWETEEALKIRVMGAF